MKAFGILLLVIGLIVACLVNALVGGVIAVVGLLMMLVGQATAEKPTCPKCGNEVVATSRLCPTCGEKIIPKCLSSHGEAGYARGTHIRADGEVICGFCKQELGQVEDCPPVTDWVKDLREEE